MNKISKLSKYFIIMIMSIVVVTIILINNSEIIKYKNVEVGHKEGETTSILSNIITGNDYGKSINYSATVNGEKLNNWRVFYNDGRNVYIILDDYLETRLMSAPGIGAADKYTIYSRQDADTLIRALETESYWSQFANGIVGATATGSPTNAQFVNS